MACKLDHWKHLVSTERFRDRQILLYFEQPANANGATWMRNHNNRWG